MQHYAKKSTVFSIKFLIKKHRNNKLFFPSIPVAIWAFDRIVWFWGVVFAICLFVLNPKKHYYASKILQNKTALTIAISPQINVHH